MARIQLRRDVAAAWTSRNPTLAVGEEGLELDTGRRKVGDGATAWNGLPYSGSAIGATFTPGGTIAATNVQAAVAEAAFEAAQKSANLSDLESASTARTNLGLGTAATQATGTFEPAGAAASAAAAVKGLPLALPGATGAARFVGGTASGAPATGTFAVGDFVVDQTGKVYACTVAGTPGTWTLSGGSAAAPTVVAGATLGAAATLDLASRQATEVTYYLSGLSAPSIVTLSNRAAGAVVQIAVQQDATGYRTFALTDGTSTVLVPVAPDPYAVTTLRVDIYSTTDFRVVIEGISAGMAPQSQIPLNTSAPSVAGTLTVGGVLTCAPGAWAGFPAPTFAYQWKANGVAIGGATSATYTILTGNIDQALTCSVTATNTSGSSTADSPARWPTYNPGSFAGAATLVGWYDMTQEPVIPDARALARLTDFSGSSRHMLPPAFAAYPRYRTAAQNAKPVARFDGLGNYVVAASSVQVQHIFIVAKHNGSVFANNGYEGLVTGTGATGTDLGLIGDGTGGAQTKFYNPTPLTVAYFRDGASQAQTAMAAPMNVMGVMSISSAGWTNPLPLQVGRDRNNAAAGRFWNGDICEIVVFNGVLTTGNRQSIEAALKAKWGTP
jgi:hypothetical protein